MFRMRKVQKYNPVIPLSFIILMIQLHGCNNTIDPFEESEALLSIYGGFNMSETRHMIRVGDVNQPLRADSTRELDAQVSLEIPEDGEVFELSGKRSAYEELYVHNFPIDLEIEPGKTYKIEAQRSDRKTVSSTAKAPQITDAYATPRGENCETEIEVDFPEALHSRRIEAEVGFTYEYDTFWVPLEPELNDEDEVVARFTPQEVIDEIFPENPPCPEGIHDEPRIQCRDFDDDYMQISFKHFGPDWDDYDTPINPLESADVKDGLGFFGIYHEGFHTVPVDTFWVFC